MEIGLFPKYTSREKEQEQIQQVLEQVKENEHSHVALVYGDGGVGKSFFVRLLPESVPLENVKWVGPIDVDDSQFWLLANLQRRIVELIDGGGHFQPYLDYLSHLPEFERQQIGHETVLAYLRRGDDIFLQCYRDFIEKSDYTPVIILDTVEAIRGTDTLIRVVHWIRQLPGTLFVLAGRPVEPDQDDPLVVELEEYPPISYNQVSLGCFSHKESLRYIDQSGISIGLDPEEKENLVLLTEGHPLWLAMSIYYLSEEGIPGGLLKSSLQRPVDPDQLTLLRNKYIRELLAPYRKRDFWHEAVLRLGVVRRRMSKDIWVQVMAGKTRPEEEPNWDTAWEKFKSLPWIRNRANQRYITLHDALAEELASRVIPKIDQDKTWRQGLWRKAAALYDDLILERSEALETTRAQIDKELERTAPGEEKDTLLQNVLEFETRQLDLHLLQTTGFYYRMLSNYQDGCDLFVTLFDQALGKHQYRLAELLWLEMQRFLPDETTFDPLEDVVGPEMEEFRVWYRGEPDVQYEIIQRAARLLNEIGRAEQAEKHLSQLWQVCQGDLEREYIILNLRGNARMRVWGKVEAAERDFQGALDRTRDPAAPEQLKIMQGQALNELGYFYRNVGRWRAAAQIYLDAMAITPFSELQKLAGIQSQYAYVEALRGEYKRAHELVDTALAVRQDLGLRRLEGMAWSVKGEVYRYEREYPDAWKAYQNAETIFEELDDRGWLGLVWQEMAICLYQSVQNEIIFPEYQTSGDMLDRSREIIERAVDLCQDYSVRAYPSALNRAGRIAGIGFGEIDQGLEYLDQGIQAAREVMDGWFRFANLVEYVELAYLAWGKYEDAEYRKQAESRFKEIDEVQALYDFPDLRGRWELLQGLLKSEDARVRSDESGRAKLLEEALGHFQRGYAEIALGYVGSHGAAALEREFEKLEHVIASLPDEVRERWFTSLKAAWSQVEDELSTREKKETSLQAHLTKLYLKLRKRENAEA